MAHGALLVARAFLAADPFRAATEVTRARGEVRAALSSPGDDLPDVLRLVEVDLALIESDLDPPPDAA